MKTGLPILISGALLACAAPTTAWAWGATGHHMISSMAIEQLPDELPAFLRTQDMPFIIGELGREPDRWRGSGDTHDKERDPGHYVDLDDDGRVFGGPALDELAETREAFDTQMREVGKTQYQGGYLPYSIVDGWQQLRKDFGYWRALVAAEENADDPGSAARFARDRQIREMLIVRDLGIWSHYVADASMPLHLSIHFNGWGDYPNPNGYSTARDLHGRFEGKFVRENITPDEVAALVPEARDCQCETWERTVDYIRSGYDQVIPLYELESQGAFNGPNETGEAFVAGRMAAAVAELRDMIVMAWQASETAGIGWPETTSRKVEAGEDPTGSLFGLD